MWILLISPQNNVLVDSKGRARIADYGLSTTCSDLNGTSYIRSNVRWTAPELFEVPDTDDTFPPPKPESDIYSFGCIMYQVCPTAYIYAACKLFSIACQVLSGHQPYHDIRSDHQVVVAILRGLKPKRPTIHRIEDCHWDSIQQCWLGVSERPAIAGLRDLMGRYRDAIF